MIDVPRLKTLSQGRWPEILVSVAGIDPDRLDGRHHPCPRCGGTDRFRLLSEETGAVLCNQCFREKNGDGIAAVSWMKGGSFPEAAHLILEYLGEESSSETQNHQQDVVEQIARKKRIPVDAFREFGAHVASREGRRGAFDVCRVPMYDANLELCSHFDLWPSQNPITSKGLSAKGKPTGLFLATGWRPQTGHSVYVTEGVKDAAALHGEEYPAVGLPTSRLNAEQAKVFAGMHVVLVPDRDDAGLKGAEDSAAFLYGIAKSVSLVQLPAKIKTSSGDGVREILALSEGAERLRRAIEQATPWQPPVDDRTEVRIGTDEQRVNDDVIRVLQSDPELFQQEGTLVVIRKTEADELPGIERPPEAPTVRPIDRATLRERIAERVRFTKAVRKTESESSIEERHPPAWCVDAIKTRGGWTGIRSLTGIIETPVLRKDGSIVCQAGYDRATGLYYIPSGSFPAVPDQPTTQQIREAVTLLREVVADFPFAQPWHESTWFAFLLTVLSRHAFAGPAPLFLADANVRGSGKTLLFDLASMILFDRPFARMSNPKDDEECRKRITSLVVAGETVVLIDNIAGTLGSASFDAALTGERWQDRLLGESTMVNRPLRMTWGATGNNVVLKADTARRVAHMRLESPLENPEERDQFRHADIRGFVRTNRERILIAALTILRGFHVAGKPDPSLKPWGSFEGWSRTVRNAIVWAGLEDPGQGRQELASKSDSEAMALRSLIAGLAELDPDRDGITSGDIIRRLEEQPQQFHTLRDALCEICNAPAGKLPSVRSVGNHFKKFLGRIVGGEALDSFIRNKTKVWFIRAIDESLGGSGKQGQPLSTFQDVSKGSKGSKGSVTPDPTHARNSHHLEKPWGEGSPADPSDPLDPAVVDVDLFPPPQNCRNKEES